VSFIQEILLIIPILLLSLSFHEYSHGKVSYLLGDPTPKLMGRLTLNPLVHLDIMGSLVLIITRRFGWAKPVPVNPRYYKNPRKGLMLVGLAGPGANIILAVLFSIILKAIINLFGFNINNGYIYGNVSNLTITSVKFLIMAIYINLSLAVFNLIPVPPLDGSKILQGVLPPRFDQYFLSLEGPIGMIILLFLAYTGLLGRIIGPVVEMLARILV
jgi:Zn-dependent protease